MLTNRLSGCANPDPQRSNRAAFAAIVAVCVGLAVAPHLYAFQASAQEPTSELSPAASSDAAARVVRWAGSLPEFSGRTVEMQFAIYQNVAGGLALWAESQQVRIDADGHYSVLLGATASEGLPYTLFPAGEPRWVEGRVTGKVDSKSTSRTLLAAVPYAFESADAQTLAGRAATDYITREEFQSASPSLALNGSNGPAFSAQPNISGTGTTNYLPIWTNSTTFGNSVLYQSGNFVGINTTAPAAALDVHGNVTTVGTLYLPPSGSATASIGASSYPFQVSASSYSTSTHAAVNQNFRFQALPVNNDTASPTAILSLLFGSGSTTATATGLSFASNGRITFAAGQTFPGTGPGTITKIVSTSPLTGGGPAGSITLGLSTSNLETILNPVYARLAAANNFAGNQTTTGSIGIGTTGPDAPLDIEAPNVGQALLISAGGPDSWAINSFGGSGSDGLAGRFVGGTGGGGISVGAGSTSDSTAASTGATISGGYSYSGPGGDGLEAYAGNLEYGAREGYAGLFHGDVDVTQNFYAAAKYFRVDHPTDPTNKYLNHVSTESSEMMNIYSGNVTTDGKGLTTVTLPAWFETINTDFRYQLTVVGQFAQAIVKNKIANSQFTIMTNAPNVEVSWMITAVRSDRYAKAHPLVVEQEKPANERGFYIHPDLYGQPSTKQSEWGRHPRQMLAQQAMRSKTSNPHTLRPASVPVPNTKSEN